MCNEWRGSFLRLSAWATQLRRNIAAVASRWQHCRHWPIRESNRRPHASIVRWNDIYCMVFIVTAIVWRPAHLTTNQLSHHRLPHQSCSSNLHKLSHSVGKIQKSQSGTLCCCVSVSRSQKVPFLYFFFEKPVKEWWIKWNCDVIITCFNHDIKKLILMQKARELLAHLKWTRGQDDFFTVNC